MPTPAEEGTFVSRSTTSPDQSRAFAIEAARLLADDRCEDVVVLDVRELSPVTDFIVIGSGTSERQMGAVLNHVKDLGPDMGFSAFRSSADDSSAWLLADFVDVVVHVFEANTRAHYDLEMLWGDAARVPWERPAGERPRMVTRRQRPEPVPAPEDADELDDEGDELEDMGDDMGDQFAQADDQSDDQSDDQDDLDEDPGQTPGRSR
jgi:ribosome-associated protein